MTNLNRTPPHHGTLVLEGYNRVHDDVAGSGIKRFVIVGCLVVAMFVGGSTYWAASSNIDGAVVAPASFVVEGNRKTVEHLEGGIVSRLLVSNGDVVEAGQVLLELDSTDLDVNLDVLTQQLSDHSVRHGRLLAQIKRSTVFEEAQVRASLRVDLEPAAWQSAFNTQQKVFDAEAGTLASEQDLQEQQIEGLQQQIAGIAEQRASNARQLEITSQELEDLETLFEKGLVAIARVNARRVEIERLKGVDASLRTQEAQAGNRISELTLSGLTQQKQRDEALSNELAQVEALLATLEPQYSGAIERRKRVAVTAPVRGRIVNMAVFTQGGVVRPGEPILDIVPDDEPLVVEARVNTADIDKLFIGQSTRIRLSAFDQNETPEALGEIVDISADSLTDERTGTPYYTTRVKLDDYQPDSIRRLEIVPGMPADLFVNTGERTALSYLTQPLHARLARTFVE